VHYEQFDMLASAMSPSSPPEAASNTCSSSTPGTWRELLMQAMRRLTQPEQVRMEDGELHPLLVAFADAVANRGRLQVDKR